MHNLPRKMFPQQAQQGEKVRFKIFVLSGRLCNQLSVTDEVLYFREFVCKEIEEVETIDDMMHKFNIASNDKAAQVKLCQELLDGYIQHKEEVFQHINEACNVSNRLEEIGLGKVMSDDVHLWSRDIVKSTGSYIILFFIFSECHDECRLH